MPLPRLAGLAALLGLILALASACGGGGDPTPTVAPGDRTATAEARAATATVDAEAALARRPPCVFDPATQEAMQAISDLLWQAGTDIGQDDASRALRFYEASIGYGLLNECRDIGLAPAGPGTPVAVLLATPITACPPGTEDALADLQHAWAKGMPITVELLMLGIEAEDIEILTGANAVILRRIGELGAACGLATPGATPVVTRP